MRDLNLVKSIPLLLIIDEGELIGKMGKKKNTQMIFPYKKLYIVNETSYRAHVLTKMKTQFAEV